jgi:predicted ribosome quality control (RQC) complex YloA/Tae2 family protein
VKLGIDTATDLYLRVKELEQQNADLRRQLEEARKDNTQKAEEWVCRQRIDNCRETSNFLWVYRYDSRFTFCGYHAKDYAPGTVLRVTAEVVKEGGAR